MNPNDLNNFGADYHADRPWLAPQWNNLLFSAIHSEYAGYGDGNLLVRATNISALSNHDVVQWQALADATPGDNPFAEYWMMHPAILHHAADHKEDNPFRLIIVQHIDGGWVGVFPVHVKQNFGRLPIHHMATWHSANQFLGTPLVRAGAEKQFWDKVLDWIDEQPKTGPLLHIQNCAADSPVVRALSLCCKMRGRPLHITSWHDRAAFAQDFMLSGDTKANRSKDQARLRTLLRRLEADIGPVMVHRLNAQDAIAPWIDAFLDLEAQGWKGKAGSALSMNNGTRRYFRDAMTLGHAQARVTAYKLVAGDRILAMNWQLTGASAGFGFKMAFDETLSAFAPGLLLMDEVCRDIEMMPILLFDSCAAPNTQYLNRRWKGRRRIISVAIGIGGKTKFAPFHIVMSCISGWHGAKSLARQLRGLWRR